VRRIEIIGATLIGLAFLPAASAGTAVAKPLLLSDPAGAVAPGTVLTGSSSNLTLATNTGSVACEDNLLSATLTTNGLSGDSATATEALGFGEFDGLPGACSSSSGGPVDVTWSGLEWPITLRGNGTSTIKGDKKIKITATFIAIAPPNKCSFVAWRVAGHLIVGSAASPAPLELTVANQPFKLFPKVPGAAPICPIRAQLSGSWTFTDGAGVVSTS